MPVDTTSVTDNKFYNVFMDWQRRLHVSVGSDFWMYPVGRVLFLDDFESATLVWAQNTGTVARDTTTSHRGTACLKLTTGNVAGNQAIARKYFMLPADQGSQQSLTIANRTARHILGCWWRQADANLRTFTIRYVVDDSTRQREWWIQYHRRQAGVDNNGVEYLASSGAATSWGTYPIDAGGIPPSGDVWNLMAQEVDYLNGTDAAGGYGWYRTQRMGDFKNPGAGGNSFATPGSVASFQGATSGARLGFVDLIATTDSANACSVFVDDFMLTDLSASLNQ